MTRFLLNGFLFVLLILFATSILSQNKSTSIDDEVASFDSAINDQHVVDDGEIEENTTTPQIHPISELGNRASSLIVEGLSQGVRLVLKLFVGLME